MKTDRLQQYLRNAVEAERSAVTAFEPKQREAFLMIAKGWRDMAAELVASERASGLVVPFDEPPPNPLADESEV